MPSLVFSFESASENSADRWLLFIASWECLVLNRLRIKYSSVTGKNIKNILFAHKHTPIHTHTQCRVFLSYSLSPTLLSSVMVRNLLQRCCISVCVRGRQKSGEENMNSYTYKESCSARTAYVACISARRMMHMRALHLHDLLKMIGLLVFLSSASQNLLVKFAQLVKCNIFPVKFPFIFIFLANSKKFFLIKVLSVVLVKTQTFAK